MRRFIRIATFSSLMVLAMTAIRQAPPPENPDPGGGGAGGGGCNVCRGTYNIDTGQSNTWCGSPDSGSWGSQYCEVLTYPEATYCQTWGNPCCVD
jgi:hypothetical protein